MPIFFFPSLGDIAGLPIKFSKSVTMAEPDRLKIRIDGVPIFPVHVEEFPRGITVDKILLKSSEVTTMTVVVQTLSSPTDPSPSTLATIVLTSDDEVEVAVGTDIEVGKILYAVPDTVDVKWIELHVMYSVK